MVVVLGTAAYFEVSIVKHSSPWPIYLVDSAVWFLGAKLRLEQMEQKNEYEGTL